MSNVTNTIMTSTETMSTTWTPDVTTKANFTYARDYTTAHVLTPITVLMVGVNLFIFIIIVSNAEMRRKPIFWNILNLCVWDLLMGVFFLPLLLHFYYINFRWIHSQHVCRWYISMDFSHAAISSCCIISICADRIFVKVQKTRSISPRASTIFNIFVVLAPWIAFFIVCLPFILSSEKDIEDQWEDHCYMDFKDEHYIAIVAVLFTLPVIILGIFIYAILIVYFEGTCANPNEDGASTTIAEMQSIRMSTLATWLVGLVSLLLMLPLSILECFFLLCGNGYCWISWETFRVTYIMFLSRGAITPWFWFMIPEVRETIKRGIDRIRNLKRSSSTQFLYRKEDD